MVLELRDSWANKSFHTNRPFPLRSLACGFIRRWPRCERLVPAAVGGLKRSAALPASAISDPL